MPKSLIDYVLVFRNMPVPALLLSPDYVIIGANEAYEEISGRSLEALEGQSIFAAFPDNPSEPGATGTSNLRDSLDRACESGNCDVMALQRYDVEEPGNPGEFVERYWCPVNAPVVGPDGSTTMVIHVVEEVSALISKFVEAQAASA